MPNYSEVCAINTPDQFVTGLTAYACGFVSVLSLTSMAPVGHSPTKNASNIFNSALSAYARYNGDTSSANECGMSLPQLYNLLQECGLHYQGLPLDLDWIRGWLTIGYPVILAVAEDHIFDIELGDVVPYPWTPSGSHVIVATGREGQHLICHDSANIIAPNTLRSQPRKYDGNKMEGGLVSATVVVPPWKTRPLSADPTKEPQHGETQAPKPTPVTPGTPLGWHDDGKTLTAPNGFKVVAGFRNFILGQKDWDHNDMPLQNEENVPGLEISNVSLGPGSQQVFLYSLLGWTKEKGVMREYIGKEYLVLRSRPPVIKEVPAPLSPDLIKELETLDQVLSPMCSAHTAIQSLLKGN